MEGANVAGANVKLGSVATDAEWIANRIQKVLEGANRIQKVLEGANVKLGPTSSWGRWPPTCWGYRGGPC